MFLQKAGTYLPPYMLSVINIYCTVNIRFQKSTCLTNCVFLFSAPPCKNVIHFNDPNATVYIYEMKGHIKTMSAFCFPNPECDIKYKIGEGKLVPQSILLKLLECCIKQS
jgi:hypothetical protein